MSIDLTAHRFVTLKCVGCGFLYNVPMSCGDRLCDTCSKRRFGVLMSRYKPFFAKYPAGALRFITLPLKNMSDLEKMHWRLRHCVAKLVAYGKKHWGWVGGVLAYQATNKGKGWHDHAHIIVEGGGFVPQDELSKVWLSITGDSFICDVRWIYNVEQSLGYMIAYALKTDGVLPEFHDEYNKVFHGRRLLQSWGTWFNRMKVNDDGDKEFACPKCGATTWVTNMSMDFFIVGARPQIVPVSVGSSP